MPNLTKITLYDENLLEEEQDDLDWWEMLDLLDEDIEEYSYKRNAQDERRGVKKLKEHCKTVAMFPKKFKIETYARVKLPGKVSLLGTFLAQNAILTETEILRSQSQS